MELFLFNKKRNISCGEARELMFDYLDGTLSTSMENKLKHHIENCSECRIELDERKALLDSIGKIELDAPKELYPNVMQLVGLTEQDKKKRPNILTARRRYIPIGTIAAACAIFVFIMLNRDTLNIINNADSAVYDIEGARYYSVMEDQTDSGFKSVVPDSIVNENDDDSVQDNALVAEAAEDEVEANLKLEATTTLSAKNEVGTLAVSLDCEYVTAAYEAFSDELTSDGEAALFCTIESLDGVLPADVSVDYSLVSEETAAQYNASIYKMSYDEATDAVEEYTKYVTLLEESNSFYESYVPENSEFDVCYYVLINTGDSDNE